MTTALAICLAAGFAAAVIDLIRADREDRQK